MKDGTAILNPPVVTPANDFALIHKHRTYGNAAFLPALTRFVKRSFQKFIHIVLPFTVAVKPERILSSPISNLLALLVPPFKLEVQGICTLSKLK
jgi:hypothetical protein